MRKKKGQVDASNAAALVALIAALIVLYIMFLPPDVRWQILQGNESNETDSGTATVPENATLLDVVPGKMSYISTTKIEHQIPAFSLYKATNAKILKTENPFYVKRGWFDENKKTMTFTVEDLQNTNNFLLSFTTKTNYGNLIVKLNSQEIFNSEITSTQAPIILPKELISKENEIELSASPVGLAFWRTNEFNIVGAQIIADVTDVSGQQSRNIFIVSATEKHNLKEVYLEFNPNCDTPRPETGILDIFLNSVNVYSAAPDCQVINTIEEISTGVLHEGENNIVFKLSKGSFLIDQIQVVTRLREEPSAVYYFELSSRQYDDLINDRKKLNMTMEFVDRGYDVEADIVINGHKTAIPYSTRERYEKTIPSEWIREDTNYINIQPKVTFDAVSLKLELADN